MRLQAAGIIFSAGIAFAGCSAPRQQAVQPAPKPPMKHVPPTPIAIKKAELGEKTWNPAWNKIVEQAIPPELLSTQVPRDVRLFCPRFYTLSNSDKRVFWAYFFQALAGAEAGLNPKADVKRDEPALAREEKVPVALVRTEGLLQLTYADEKRYGCPFDEKADAGLPMNDPRRSILRPENNLLCGIKILDNQIVELHKPLLSRTSYWATLRPGTFSYRLFAKQMTNPPAVCGLHPERPRGAESRIKSAE